MGAANRDSSLTVHPGSWLLDSSQSALLRCFPEPSNRTCTVHVPVGARDCLVTSLHLTVVDLCNVPHVLHEASLVKDERGDYLAFAVTSKKKTF